MRIFTNLLLCCIFLIPASCQNEKSISSKSVADEQSEQLSSTNDGQVQTSNTITPKDIIGSWEVTDATGKLKDTNVGAMYIFDDEQRMFIEKIIRVGGPFTIDKGILTHNLEGAIIEYRIYWQDDKLILDPRATDDYMILEKR